jgi:hypothetical protein
LVKLASAKCFAGQPHLKKAPLGFLIRGSLSKHLVLSKIAPDVINRLFAFLIRTRTDAHYTRTNENAGLTKVAKPASIEAGTTGLKINDLRRA